MSRARDVLGEPEACAALLTWAGLEGAEGIDVRSLRAQSIDRVADVEYRHAFEVRHPTYFCQEFFDLLRVHQCAFVVADTAGKFPYAEEVTADFVYVRLHGSRELYASGYTDAELDGWAGKIDGWRSEGRDVYVYFDNDAKVHAPFDAIRLGERLRQLRQPLAYPRTPRYIHRTPR